MKRAVIVGIFLFSFVIVNAVLARNDDKIYWCHCEPNGNCQTLHLPLQALKNAGHVSAQGNPLHAGDHAGACTNPTNTPTPTLTVTTAPTATPTVTPTPTITECGDCVTPTPTVEQEPTPTPTEKPRVTPTPTEAPKQEANTSTTGVNPGPRCEATPPTKTMANFHIYRKGDDAIVKWTATEGDRANIYYKQVKSDVWQYSLRDIQNTGYVEIHGLGTLDITFAGQQSNGCAGGPLTEPVVDGNTNGWVLFR